MANQRGFNLIDLLIGVAISLIGLLAVATVLIDFNKQRNTTTQTLEAQNNGTMALYLLERDLTPSGYGLMSIQDCTAINWYYAGGVRTPLTTLPVKITDGGASSDSVEIQYGVSNTGVPSVLSTQAQTFFGDPISVASIVGFNAGDVIVADAGSTGGTCEIFQVSGVNTVARTISLATGAGYPYNATSQPAGWTLVQPNNVIVNLGNFTGKRYSVATGNLQVGAFPSYATTTLVDGIVFMKAQYGLDTDLNGTVDNWVSGATAIDNTTAKQVIAIRVGIVARSPLYEKNAVDAPTVLCVLPDTTTGTCPASSTSKAEYTVPDAHYRYKVYYTIIPLRNAIWGQ